MSEINNGGPAFPIPLHEGQSYQVHAPCDGMLLRDYFAAKAMPEIYQRVESGGYDRVAALSYEMADAMLRARGAA